MSSQKSTKKRTASNSTKTNTSTEEWFLHGFSTRQKIAAPVGLLLSFALQITSYRLASSDQLKLYGTTNPATLTDFSSKLQFTLKYLQIQSLWLVFTIMNAGFRRSGRAADPLAGYEHLVQWHKNLIQNSLETVAFSVLTQLALITYLSGEQVAKFIPLLNVLFLIGRIAFFLGYPRYRSFGYSLSFFPSLAAAGYAAYHLANEQLGIYVDFL